MFLVLALPFADRELKNKLSKQFKVSGIPMLIVLDGNTGSLITADGRSSVSEDKMGKNFPWTPPTFAEAMLPTQKLQVSELKSEQALMRTSM
tara:strand:+ start:576 stop:851 length:276 start_codon:yes stop_codon:yes gene_type:complete